MAQPVPAPGHENVGMLPLPADLSTKATGKYILSFPVQASGKLQAVLKIQSARFDRNGKAAPFSRPSPHQ